jgi:hypothetical protein
MKRFLKTLFALLGFAVFVGWVLSEVGIGHFVLSYGAAPIQCTVYDLESTNDRASDQSI